LLKCVEFTLKKLEIFFLKASPDTPLSLNVLSKTYSSVLLQWRPEFDGGSEQKFIILVNSNQEIESTSETYLVTSI
jgi:hypothetical protein